MALCTITGFVYMPNGRPARRRLFRFKAANNLITADDGGIIVPDVVDAATNSAGFLEVTLATGSYTASSTLYNGRVVVPDADTATLYEVFGGVGPVDPPVDIVPVFTTPLADVVLTVGDADVVVNLDDNTDNATSYSVSPAGGAVTISGSSMAVSASAEVDQVYVVTATGPGGTATDSFGVLVVAAAPSMSRLAVHIDSDIDTVGERDDISAMALWLGNQDDFNLLGFTCSPPDGNHQEYINCINAYEADRATIIAQPGITSSDFKTGADLLALVQDGANADAPSRGYRLSGESQYTNAHAAAQLLIANARDHGDPASNDPTRKLWVIVQGGFVTLAQALYEAMDPAGPMELPDILDRIRVVGQPNWNSAQAPNAWSYIFGNAWPASGTPGMFGDLWMLCGYLQWHAFNRDNGTTDATFWNEITANSAFGTHLRNTLTRPSAACTTPHFRAGDAGTWFWLKSAKDQGNYSPTNAANLCGVYRTYEGRDPWPSQTVGYGSGSGLGSVPNPEGITWSPTIWAPELTVDSFEDSYTAVNLDAWYTMVRGYMERYQPPVVVTAPAQVAIPTVSGTGTSRTISWTAPADGGSPITDYVITLDGQVVADGVSTATSYELAGLADATYSVTVAAVNAEGTGPASDPLVFTVDNTVTVDPDATAILTIVNFRGSGDPSAGFNEMIVNAANIPVMSNLLNTAGGSTGTSLAISFTPASINQNSETDPGYTSNSLGDPNWPTYSGHLMASQHVISNLSVTRSATATLVLSGLVPGRSYRVQWVGSRTGLASPRLMSLTLNGTTVQWNAQTIPATTQTATVAADDSGIITMTTSSQSTSFQYLGALSFIDAA